MIIIEGNIGSGKTTLGRILSEELGGTLYEELTNNFTGNVLERFYNNKKDWAFELQVQFLAERFGTIYQSQEKDELAIFDRSIYGDALFADTLHEDGAMSTMQHTIYSNLLSKMLKSAKEPSLLVYLKSSTDHLMAKIEERSRGNESLIERGYIDRLNSIYDKWYNQYDLSPKLSIDKDLVDLHDHQDREEVINLIKNLLK